MKEAQHDNRKAIARSSGRGASRGVPQAPWTQPEPAGPQHRCTSAPHQRDRTAQTRCDRGHRPKAWALLRHRVPSSGSGFRPTTISMWRQTRWENVSTTKYEDRPWREIQAGVAGSCLAESSAIGTSLRNPTVADAVKFVPATVATTHSGRLSHRTPGPPGGGPGVRLFPVDQLLGAWRPVAIASASLARRRWPPLPPWPGYRSNPARTSQTSPRVASLQKS